MGSLRLSPWGRLIESYRLDQGLSQPDVARELRVPVSTYRAWLWDRADAGHRSRSGPRVPVTTPCPQIERKLYHLLQLWPTARDEAHRLADALRGDESHAYRVSEALALGALGTAALECSERENLRLLNEVTALTMENVRLRTQLAEHHTPATGRVAVRRNQYQRWGTGGATLD